MNRETVLEYRYRRLLRLYPRAWRREHEDAMTATYLDSGPQRARPSMMDTADVVRGAARTRMTAAGSGLDAGPSVAAELALAAASVLAALWFCLFELAPIPEDYLLPRFGAFQSLGAIVWITWAAVPVAGMFLNGRRMRIITAAALAVTSWSSPRPP